ncbi:MAG TPA: DUF4435 domain-containing protein [Gammaproteobacteria bacterium]|nr:DUF4435 domain-containing protein [Gammaproteobacteria bacterium]
MSFRRTESGLTNLYRFFGVDAVVYLEGGNSLCREDLDRGSYTNSTPDIRYWQTLFSIYRPNKTYKFCSVGSKETVKSIAKDIMDGRVNNMIAAMDRDFDHINGKIITSNNVIYTFGYSWENDAWNKSSLREAFCTLSGACSTEIETETEVIDKYYKECASKLLGPIRIDAVLSQYDNSLFNRKSYMQYVNIQNNGMPIVNMEQIKSSLVATRNKVEGPIFRKENFILSFVVDCFGHLLAEYAYRILAYLLEKIRRNPKLPKDYAASMVVEKFGQLLANGSFPELKRHYDSEFSRIMPVAVGTPVTR